MENISLKKFTLPFLLTINIFCNINRVKYSEIGSNFLVHRSISGRVQLTSSSKGHDVSKRVKEREGRVEIRQLALFDIYTDDCQRKNSI